MYLNMVFLYGNEREYYAYILIKISLNYKIKINMSNHLSNKLLFDNKPTNNKKKPTTIN